MEIEVTQRAAEMLIDKFALVIKAIDMFEKIEVRMDTCRVHRLINAFPMPCCAQTALMAASENNSIFNAQN